MVGKAGERLVALARSSRPLLLEQGREEGLLRVDLVFRREEEVEEFIASLAAVEVGVIKVYFQFCL